MAQPQVPIDVDPETGIWRTDGLPMIYLPRHFLVNLQKGIEAAIGVEAYRTILYGSSDLSALQWCREEARTHGLTPLDTFRHHLKRLSQRGYGLLEITALDAVAGTAVITIRNSAFALGYGPGTGRPVCSMFEGSFAGGMRFVLEQAGHPGEPVCREVACAADGHAECRFELRCEAAG
ncbi:4-vinyl reductase [Roseomonas hellenica]|uniref:4-vinyl reductase n=1 Tax=Plastoroseomonas hellenica TaxID=2687306 RepID=A0ABS5ETM5_9PROT|nr:4-vinyl reductase [Plastoroseomonas hellenica]MBR0663644.1 4-vinyl reductase [Plastoroseomonas hellenica]